MDRHTRFLNLAYRYTADRLEAIPMAAVITYGSTVVCHGVNKSKSNPRQLLEKNPFRATHAELDAISRKRFKLQKGATIYVVRRLKNGNLAMAKPCVSCLKAIRSAGIKRVVYSIGGFPADGCKLQYGVIEL